MKFAKTISNYLKKFLILTIDFYSYAISPFLGRNCRYHPSCSQYAKEAIAKKGVVKGLIMSAYRILRCNPFSKGGFDPVK
ncbi:MAG: membrane protein insertion efficiency factor YidD [Deferribacterales bacterium]|jgi:hypothetical protein|uniref:membrane protein insertion efficiency factor YidD n=1 Tax=Deferrivibrio essentukiensis TaxID=2880922 RepID=UPI00199CDE61|nr:membrane protein insertion efficiency factor YidD [Deferrivibrio essentukiensis]MBC7196930.1 membrane protein insertion efficiency factor YidD [Deferribacterales bacterium]MCB4203910.1 membrane protein insertion efficiency factor YidD [Deferrivibrio essentukiensis]